MEAKQVFSNMAPYTPGKQIEDVKKEYGLDKIVKLASNENPFGYSEKVREAIPNMLNGLEIYPDGYAKALREEIAAKLSVKKDQLTFGCGSDEIIDMLCKTYLEKGTNTIMATPSFPQYKHNALIQGAEIIEVPLINGYHDLAAMLKAVNEATRIVWLCSPNNPTGSLISKEDLIDFLEKCPDHTLVVLDEAYYEYIDRSINPNSVALLNDYDNLVILRTFSKAYGLANLRVGYGIASEEITKYLNITRGPFNTTTISQLSALTAFLDTDFLEKTYQENITNKQTFMQFCDDVGLEYYDSEANFLFVKLPTSGDQLFTYLLKNGFIVRSGEALGHPNGVRITIGSKENMTELQELMKNYLATV
ncbi:histidinol-phosphate transaminase [Gracilibacillus oryzae]|uniref:Histidinol-phosphate aminotransferase n=1 Tax=Gracilibacillus oryzae TaxID=1672701 RepID=A0A7C8GV33_9BACI|nr:histidinol-phosphate transaminase [Gracilibacillus oryzae]KAB8138479.1 histidinol-phosphate transaminase [Gracilibacillus oryzae]